MEFRGQYYFLSNYYNSPLSIEIGGEMLEFSNAEAAFQACRAVGIAKDFQGLSASEAKALGKKARKKDVREDWAMVRDSEMERVLAAKFRNPYLANKLLSVSSDISFEVQYPDRYWGIYLGKGQNKLGKALSNVRRNLLKEAGIYQEDKQTKLTYKVQNGGLVVFDTETTGVSAKYDDIIQITIVGKDRNVLLSTYVRPENCKTWPEAEAVNHISPSDVFKEGVPTAAEVAKAVKHIFSKAGYVLGYNVNFDTKMVKARFGYDFSENKVQDVFDLYKALTKVRLDNYVKEVEGRVGGDKKALNEALKTDETYAFLLEKSKKRKLVNAVESECPEVYEEFIGNAHDACADTKATLDLAKKIMSYDDDLLESCAEYLSSRDGNDSCISKWSMSREEFDLCKSPALDNPLFFVKEGVICLACNVQNILADGFVKRIASTYKVVYDAIKEEKLKMAKERIEKGRSLSDFLGTYKKVNITGDLSVLLMYVIDENNENPFNYDALHLVLSKVCANTDEAVYLPVVTKWEDGVPIVTDSIGQTSDGSGFDKIMQVASDVNKGNLYFIDTQQKKTFSSNSQIINFRSGEGYNGVEVKDEPCEELIDGIELG